MSLDDNRLDQLLNQPLAGLADDGFTLRLMRRAHAGQRRMQFLLWGLILAALLPVLVTVPVADWAAQLANGVARAADTPVVSYFMGALVLLWVWKPRFFPR